MQETILVPVDFSEHALTAVKYAVTLARAQGSKVLLMHAYHALRSSFQSDLANKTDLARAELGARKNMQSFLDTLAAAGYNGLDHEIFHGSISSGVRHCQKSRPITLVVMGTKGRRGLAASFLGSNALEMASKLTIPLLIVPADLTPLSFDRPLFFTDYQQADEKTLQAYLMLAPKEQQQCTLVHISRGDHEHMSKERSKLENYGQAVASQHSRLRITAEVLGGAENTETVEKAIQLYEADIVLITIVRGRKFFENFLHKSLAKAIVLNSTVPVLIVGEEDQIEQAPEEE